MYFFVDINCYLARMHLDVMKWHTTSVLLPKTQSSSNREENVRQAQMRDNL